MHVYFEVSSIMLNGAYTQENVWRNCSLNVWFSL